MSNKIKDISKNFVTSFKNKSKKDHLFSLLRFFLIVIGSFSLAFGTVIFYTKLDIVAGGLSGIAIIIQHFFPQYHLLDIVVWSLTVIFWIIGRIFLSREFAYKTLAASILYPLFLTLLYRVPGFDTLAVKVADDGGNASLILCSLFGGAFTGLGVALCFLGGGSSGGVDVFSYMGQKYLHIKASICSFIIDGIIIILGMTIIPDNFVKGLCGMLSAFFCALVIDLVYNNMMTSYQADIISNESEEISRFAQDVLGRGATIISAKGGYKGDDRPILRIVIPKMQYEKLRDYVASIDPNAFMTLTRTNDVFGEGFTKNASKKRKK